MLDTENSQDEASFLESTPEILDTVRSCHLFGIGEVGDKVFLTAVDDCRVSIFAWDGDPNSGW